MFYPGNLIVPADFVSICAEAFAGCKRLMSANVPKDLTNIDETAFTDCPAEDVFFDFCGDEDGYEGNDETDDECNDDCDDEYICRQARAASKYSAL